VCGDALTFVEGTETMHVTPLRREVEVACKFFGSEFYIIGWQQQRLDYHEY